MTETTEFVVPRSIPMILVAHLLPPRLVRTRPPVPSDPAPRHRSSIRLQARRPCPAPTTKRICLRTRAGMSSKSGRFSSGAITVCRPARCAASTFSFSPPMGSTRPRRVTSPVIAISRRTPARPVMAEMIAAPIVIPADGPSFGTPPAGTCTCRSRWANSPGSIPSSPVCALAYDSAARADSLITSPSWPVRRTLPAPAIQAASTSSTSPPTGVTAKPVATPTSGVRDSSSGRNLRRPQRGAHPPRRHPRGRTVVGRDAAGQLAAHGRQFTFQVPHTRLARVVSDHFAHRPVGKRDPGLPQAVVANLPRQQEPLRNAHLFFLGVAAQFNDLHAVAQHRRNVLGRVGGGHEQHPRQVERHFQVVVRKSCGCTPGPALPATPMMGRPESRGRSCRSRPAALPGCASRRAAAPG